MNPIGSIIRLLSLILVFSLTLVSCSKQPAPNAVFSSQINLGEIQPSSERQLSIEIKNTGNKDLILSEIKTTCSCTLVGTKTLVIPSGGINKLEVVLKVAEVKDAYKQSILFRTNDPSNPLGHVDLIANVKAIVELSRPSIDFFALNKDELPRTWEIAVTLDRPIKEKGDISVKTSDYFLKAVTQRMGGNEWNLQITLDKTVPIGQVMTAVELQIPFSDYTMTKTIDVGGAITGMLSANPGFVILIPGKPPTTIALDGPINIDDCDIYSNNSDSQRNLLIRKSAHKSISVGIINESTAGFPCTLFIKKHDTSTPVLSIPLFCPIHK